MEANELRKKILQMSHDAGACHIGSALSCVEICLALDKMKGTILFSKASGAATIYAMKGLDWKHLKENPLLYPGGSLGHGLPIAVGMALADRSRKVYVLMSDAELNEGTTWESLLFASQHKLNNLVIVIDKNDLQACGKTDDILSVEPLFDKFKSFGCETRIVSWGHKQDDIEKALTYPPIFNKPIAIIVNTIKGFPIDFMSGEYSWHYKNLTPALLKKALKQL